MINFKFFLITYTIKITKSNTIKINFKTMQNYWIKKKKLNFFSKIYFTPTNIFGALSVEIRKIKISSHFKSQGLWLQLRGKNTRRMAQSARLNLRMQKELKLLLTDPPPGAAFPALSDDSSASSLTSIDARKLSIYRNYLHKTVYWKIFCFVLQCFKDLREPCMLMACLRLRYKYLKGIDFPD